MNIKIKQLTTIGTKFFGLYLAIKAIEQLIQTVSYFLSESKSLDSKYFQWFMITSLIYLILYIVLSILLLGNTKRINNLLFSKHRKEFDENVLESEDLTEKEISSSLNKLIQTALKVIGLLLVIYASIALVSSLSNLLFSELFNFNVYRLMENSPELIGAFAKLIIGVILLKSPKWLTQLIED